MMIVSERRLGLWLRQDESNLHNVSQSRPGDDSSASLFTVDFKFLISVEKIF